jgi:hypothetical protein
MPEVAKLLISSKLINTVAKCANKGDGQPLLSQMYILCYDHKIMIAAMDGFCLAMRMIVFDDCDMQFKEIDEATANHRAALGAIGMKSWMFPADLKIPAGLNVTVTLYEDFSTVLQTKNAVYGPFQRVATISDGYFNIHSVFLYPHGKTGSSRVFTPARIAKLVCALGDKKDSLIFNTTGGAESPLYIKDINGNAYGMVLPIKCAMEDGAAAFDIEEEEPGEEESEE